MPGVFNGKATDRIFRAVATKVKDMDDAEVANLEAICWNVSALNSALASSLITTTTGEVGTLVCRVLQAFLQQIEHDRVLDADRVSWIRSNLDHTTLVT